MNVEITHTHYNVVASLELPDCTYDLEAHLELDTHPVDKYPQIVFFVFDAVRQNKKCKSRILVSDKERVFQILMAYLQGLVVSVVVVKDNKWFDLSKGKSLYYLKPYTPRPKINTQLNILDLIE